MADEMNGERESFKAWMAQVGGPHFTPSLMEGNPLARQLIQAWWTAWQARASLAANAGSEPVAYVDGDDAQRRILWEPNQAAFDLSVGTKLYTHPSPPEGMVAPMTLQGAQHAAPVALVEEVMQLVRTLEGQAFTAATQYARDDDFNGDRSSDKCDEIKKEMRAKLYAALAAPPIPASEAKGGTREPD